MTDTLIARLRQIDIGERDCADAADRIEALQAEVYMVQQIGRYWESKAAELQSRLTALESDKEVLLGHMDTINRCSNDPAIYNLSKVVIERFASGAAPTHVWAATSKTMQLLFANEADARKMQPTTTSPFDVQRVTVIGSAPQQAEPANTNYSNAQHPDWGGIKQAEPKEQT